MKFFTSQISYFVSNRNTRTNIKRLIRFILILILMIVVYGVLFHEIMEYEGQRHSWITGFYWTLTTMTTLGFGDITFTSDIGRIFSIVVLGSGVISLLIMLPFTFIEFFYAPWMEAQHRARAPRELPLGTKDHIIITSFDPVTRAFIEKLEQYGHEYVLLVNDLQKALDLYDQGYRVMLGESDDPETYRKMYVQDAAMVVTGGTDMFNTNVAHTVRELSSEVKIISTANSYDSIDILRLAGSDHVLHMGNILGRALSRRTLGQDARVHTVGRFGELVVAEATTYNTPLVGKTLRESRLREDLGINVVGIWERGTFLGSHPDVEIKNYSVLVLAGSVEQLRKYDELFGIYGVSDEPIVIIGAGRVGRATARHLAKRNIQYRIVDKNPDRIREDDEHYVYGDAADLETLKKAGIDEAPSIIITTHADDVNIYLTIYARSLRPNIHIIARSTLERNVNTLHRAGADFVMSYASMGANAIFNIFEENDIVMIAEGLNVFSLKTPSKLTGQTLAECDIRSKTGCNVIAWQVDGKQHINPEPGKPIPENSEIILIGQSEDEQKFIEYYKSGES
ncbi:potassium channel family protein [Gracilimonas mengyeensis]|uniref:Trk system potassium uptake protein TrkA n=1 Tax=Gracilimonas mengyeensis TaxID=1302730 RepID=A0A521CXU8_9BACT|nr:potassium channel protein [Gracilimonas mengyeensis]SMO63490.1 Trk K+ transport system, NAD-binding component [Gracilimonas mengyeensis]